MGEIGKKSLKIDLNLFKIHLSCEPDIELTLHFNTPSRKFYLAVIAFVVTQMKNKGRFISIRLENYMDELVLLNRTIGKSAGSSKKEHLLPRIYRKWKDALPDLEKAPLFKVVGKKKRYDDSMEKVYIFSETEKDHWANLFEYMGSYENVRLKFAMDKLLLGLEDVQIIYRETLSSSDAWEYFVMDLKQDPEHSLKNVDNDRRTDFDTWAPEPENRNVSKKTSFNKWFRIVAAGAIVVLVAVVFWQNKISVLKMEKVADVNQKTTSSLEIPSIAVLAFDNMSGDPKKEYLSDGITEQIITSLSKVPRLFVISRTSTFSYKNRAVKIQQIAEELDVRFVLEGSVQQSKDRIRITAQLINGKTGRHLWAERYEREYQDLFALQDEITFEILNQLQVKLTEGDEGKFVYFKERKPDLKAYEKIMEGTTYLRAFNMESNNTARKLAREAIELDPQYYLGYNLMAGVHIMDVWLFSSESPSDSINKAIELLQKSISFEENNNDSAYSLLCHVYAMKRQFEKSIEAGEKAIELNPNSDAAYVWLAMTLRWVGEPEEAIKLHKKAIQLSPFPPAYYYLNLGNAYMTANRFDEAIREFKKTLLLTPKNFHAFDGLTICYGSLNRMEESRAAAAEMMKLNPNHTIKPWSEALP